MNISVVAFQKRVCTQTHTPNPQINEGLKLNRLKCLLNTFLLATEKTNKALDIVYMRAEHLS